MYLEHFGLRAKPFQLTPDARFFFPSKEHKRALAFLEYGLAQGDGFIVVTGDVGTGKTTLVQALLKQSDLGRVSVASVVTTAVEEGDLIYLVASSLGINVKSMNKALLLKELERLCIKEVRRGRRVLVIVDEAQNLPKASVEELRMLSNFAFNGQPLLQIFLLGQEEFRIVLLSEGFEQLRQRVIATYHLNPLEEDEVRTYVEHRLTQVGWRNDPEFSDDAFAVLAELTGGVPRRINNLCDRVLLFAYLEEIHRIDGDVIETVYGEIDSEFLSGVPAHDDEGEAPRPQVFDKPGQPLESMARNMFDKADMQQRMASIERAVDGLGASLRPEVAEMRNDIAELRQVMEAVLDELRALRGGVVPIDRHSRQPNR